MDDAVENKYQSSVIFTDSLSAIDVIKNHTNQKQHPIAQQILNNLLLNPHTNVTICWIPSHVGIRDNDKVDQLARESALMSPVPNISVPRTDLNLFFKNLCDQKFDQSWRAISSSNKLRSIRANTGLWTTSSHPSRRIETALFRLRTGHTLLTHQYILNKTPPPICETCHVQVTVAHILSECTLYSTQRNTHDMSTTISQILKDHPQSVNKLISFLKATELLSKM